MTSAVPVLEYQWWDELANDLSTRPPGSNFIGKFSIVADPAVNNSARAFVCANQLHAHGIPFLNTQSPSCRRLSGNASVLVFSCSCREACGGQFIVSVDDDASHHGVAGQRIGVARAHPSR